MGFPEKRGDYYRARYKDANGKYPSVKDANGQVIKYRTAREARQAANDEEAKVRAGQLPAAGPVLAPTFGEYVARWYARQELAASTMENYRNHIEAHLLPAFGHMRLPEITRAVVDAWELSEKQLYEVSSVATYRRLLALILDDAIDEGELEGRNPARPRRGRGRRAGRSKTRTAEKVITDALGALLVAERAAIMTGRDDEFVMVILATYTQMRWGEITGLEEKYVRDEVFRVEAQLYELLDGSFVWCPPKDDSYRTIDSMPWLTKLVRDHIARTRPAPCSCHGLKFIFRAASLLPERRITRSQIATEAGVGPATVSRALGQGQVSEESRRRVQEALARLRGAGPTWSDYTPHWGRNEFRHSVFTPAASGWYPSRGSEDPPRPVCVRAEPWPGQVVRGRYSATQSDACWVPIKQGLTPHGLRHSGKAIMEDLGTPKVLIDERMGHIDSSTPAIYSHVTAGMRLRLKQGLTDVWRQALAARAALSPWSPVRALDELLTEHLANPQPKIISQISPILTSLPEGERKKVASELLELLISG
ncbi:LacI family DNA-binding transcriptional regulator [Streptomyces sp. NPDC006339]|uniref:LacI family DNA-binding transcriptional regulator n=1 Tax=Streptomyces sp. NPDC006339 TaxID=3156755 RepID=UPI0033B2C9BC